MQRLPEKADEFDEIPTHAEMCAKRQKVLDELAAMPRAAVPKWLVYDHNQIHYFKEPQEHENAFARLFSPEIYTYGWVSSYITDIRLLVSGTFTQENITASISCDRSSESPVLTLSNLIFDHFVVQHRIHELIFWSLICACFCKNINLFVIEDPLPLVRQAFLQLAQARCFEFSVDTNQNLTLDYDNIKKILSTIPDDVRATHCMNFKNIPPWQTPTVKCFPFSSTTHDGIAITQDYLENFEYFLTRILVTPREQDDQCYTTEVARIKATFGGDCLELFRFEARPCFQGLGGGRIILYVLMIWCIDNGIATFNVTSALKPTQILCKSLGFQLMEKSCDDYSITLEEMRKRMEPEQCGIPSGLLRRDEKNRSLFRLDRARFPTADQLNNQAAVDARRVHHPSEKGNKVDSIDLTVDEPLSKRHKSTAPVSGGGIPETKAGQAESSEPGDPRAVVPKWLIYDEAQKRFFGTPRAHESRFQKFFSPGDYEDRWVGSVIEFLHRNESSKFARILDKLSLTVSTEGGILNISYLMFDNYVVRYKIHNLIFWTLVWKCFGKNIRMFVVSNPAPLVRRAFLEMASTYHFEFNIDSEQNLSIDGECIQRLLSNVPEDIEKTKCLIIPNLLYSQVPYSEFNLIPPTSPLPDGMSVSQQCWENFEYFLSRIQATPVDYGDCFFTTEVAKLCMCPKGDFDMLIVRYIEIRPRAQRLKLGRMILHTIIEYCVNHNIKRLYVHTAYHHMATLCVSMGFKKIEKTTNHYIILLDEMKKRALPEQCGLPSGLLRRDETHPSLFRLNRDCFPTADQLNDQAAVDARMGGA